MGVVAMLGSQAVGSDKDSAEAEDEFASLNSIIITTSLLVLIVIGYRINTHRLRHFPESGAAMGLGFCVGIAVRALQLTDEEELLNFKSGFFFFVLLPPIIFEAGLSLETQIFIDNLGSILAYAVPGTLVSTWAVSWGTHWAAGLGAVGLTQGPQLILYCYLFGALISATDPVATIALFGGQRFRTDPLLHSLINGESVLNDAVAIALFQTLTRHADRGKQLSLFDFGVLSTFFLVSLCSLCVGLLAGAFCSWCFCRAKFLRRFPEYEISLMCLGAYLTFAFTQLMGLSGIVALFIFGVVLAQYNWYNLSERSKVASKVAFGMLAKVSESCVFIYLGVMAALAMGRFHWHLGLIAFAVILITIARALHVFPLAWLLNHSRDRKIDRNMQVALWMSGLRGAIAFALSLRVPCDGGAAARRGTEECRNSDLLVTTTITIVVLTTVIVGSSMESIMTVLGVIEPMPTTGIEQGQRSSETMLGEVEDLSVPLAAEPATRWQPREWPEESDEPRRSTSSSRLWALRQTLRFNARGELYQAFARFDLNVLQPALGGPTRQRIERGAEQPPRAQQNLELVEPSDVLPQDDAAQEEPPPSWSRSVIFE